MRAYHTEGASIYRGVISVCHQQALRAYRTEVVPVYRGVMTICHQRGLADFQATESDFAGFLPVAGGCIAIAVNLVAIYDEHSNYWFVVTRKCSSRQQRRQKIKPYPMTWDPWIESIVFATVVGV